ncbi:MAG: alkaline phosphatase family protein [Dehalococcoidia bacterium]
MAKILLIILDGLGDRPAPGLEGKTPLEAAYTPNMDALAKVGINGLYSVFAPGVPVGSPIALHTMFNYPGEDYPDRGVLIAVSRGFETNYEDVVLAARFASVEPHNGQLKLRARFIKEAEEACCALASAIAYYEKDGLRFRYQYWGRGDGILYISGDASPDISDSDPLGLDLPVIKIQPMENAREKDKASRTAEALNSYLSWAYREMSRHPVAEQRAKDELYPINFLITKWSGRRTKLEPFKDKFGLMAVSMPAEEVVKGLAAEMGMAVLDTPNELEPEVDIKERLKRAEELFSQGYEFIHLHTKEPDATSHWCDPCKTKEVIEALDRGFGYYWEHLGRDEDLVTVLTSDHTTPSAWEGFSPGDFNDQHSGEPVPLTIKGRHVRRDDVSSSGERPCSRGGLGHVRGAELMEILLSLADRTNLLGMRPTPRIRPYRPKQVEPFVPTS